MNKKLIKITGLVAVGSAAVLFSQLAIAAPPGGPGPITPKTPTASDDISFAGTVAPECSVQLRSDSYNIPRDYGMKSNPGGATNNIKNKAGLEKRVTQLEASDSISFDCNTDTVDLTVTATDVTAPQFSNAENIDLLTSTEKNGVDHLVDVGLNGKDAAAPMLDIQVLAASTTHIVDPTVGGNDVATDNNGDLMVKVTSTFVVAGTAEELGAGDYAAEFTVSVTAP